MNNPPSPLELSHQVHCKLVHDISLPDFKLLHNQHSFYRYSSSLDVLWPHIKAHPQLWKTDYIRMDAPAVAYDICLSILELYRSM